MRNKNTINKRSNKRCHEYSNRREHGVSGCMTSGGTTIHIICGMKYTTEMICGGGAEHNDQRMDSKSKLEIEISEKKRREFVCF